MPKRMAGKRKIRPSPGSKRGTCYVLAGNERIKNEGEITFGLESLEGHKESFVFQIAAVNKALGSGAFTWSSTCSGSSMTRTWIPTRICLT